MDKNSKLTIGELHKHLTDFINNGVSSDTPFIQNINGVNTRLVVDSIFYLDNPNIDKNTELPFSEKHLPAIIILSNNYSIDYMIDENQEE